MGGTVGGLGGTTGRTQLNRLRFRTSRAMALEFVHPDKHKHNKALIKVDYLHRIFVCDLSYSNIKVQKLACQLFLLQERCGDEDQNLI